MGYWSCLKRSFVFKGRSTRSEIWAFAILNPIVASLFGFVIGMFFGGISGNSDVGMGAWTIGFYIWIFLTLMASFSLFIRRLHDVDYSGWFFLIILIPFIGLMILWVVVYFIDGTVGSNSYGADPRGRVSYGSVIDKNENLN